MNKKTGQNFRIGAVQARAKDWAFLENTETALRYMKEAKGQGADLVLFPECFLTGYALPAVQEQVLSVENSYFKQVQRAAAELHIGVVMTALTKGRKKPRNSAFLIDREGKIQMQYDKVHTCDFSYECCLEHGTEFRVQAFDGVNIGIMICYDREYPESARVLMMKGAEIILVPNDCSGMRPRIQALSTRAYENMTAVFMANPPGEGAGNSCGFSPICWDEEGGCIDNQIFLAGEREEGIFYGDVDLKALRAYRESEMLGNTFRKPEAYRELLSEKREPPFVRKIGTE